MSTTLSTYRAESPKERVRQARVFLEYAKREFARGRARADMVLIRQSAEKAFHALAEACHARIQKEGIAVPGNHTSVSTALEGLKDRALKDLYWEAFGHLHSRTYYEGHIDYPTIERLIRNIDTAVERVEKRIGR